MLEAVGILSCTCTVAFQEKKKKEFLLQLINNFGTFFIFVNLSEKNSMITCAIPVH